MKTNTVNVKSLFFFLVFVLLSSMILSPISATSQRQLKYSNETVKDYRSEDGMQWKIVKESVGGSRYDHNETDLKSNTHSNPVSTSIHNRSAVVSLDLTSFLSDKYLGCKGNFKCTANFSTGWKDDTSFQVSTRNNTNNTWSSIKGIESGVEPGEEYRLVSHMKLNKWARGSDIVLEGFNETSQRWHKIMQCPGVINGPLEWMEFSCVIQIPKNTTKIRPVLNAGWSSNPKKEATTWFDSPSMILSRPVLTDPNLKAEIVYQGLKKPTSMAFLGPNDILVSEGAMSGTVQRIVNGVKLGKPLLHAVVTSPEGVLGIAIEKNVDANKLGTNKKVTYVFVYITGGKKVSDHPIKENGPVGNRLYRFEFVNNSLINPKLLLDLPSATDHNGGPILIGPDKHIYLAVGELKNRSSLSLANEKNKALNHQGKDTKKPDGRGGILRFDQNGNAILMNGHGILGDEEPLNKYYAYGIRNIFGIDFDPLTGKLWDTENGPNFGDEINLVEPGFDSGWRKVQGVWTVDDVNTIGKKKGISELQKQGAEKKGILAPEIPDNLVDFGGKGKYSPPEFTWNRTVGPTAIRFITTDKLGKAYKDDILVADTNGPRIYHFDLDKNRTALRLQGPLIDKVADSNDELANVVFAKDFGGRITDLVIGPDGYLYVLVIDSGTIYRIVPSHPHNANDSLG